MHRKDSQNGEYAAAKLRLEAAKKWASSASKNLRAAQTDDADARHEVKRAEAYLQSIKLKKKKKQVADYVAEYDNLIKEKEVGSSDGDISLCTDLFLREPQTAPAEDIAREAKEEKEWVTNVTVSGCGIPSVNGEYTICGLCDDVPKYVKNPTENGPQVSFMIYRCKTRDERRRWYISIVNPNVAVCYSAKNLESGSDTSPPTDRWMNVATKDYEPSLRVMHGVPTYKRRRNTSG